jgi:hypothetical protein
MLVGRRRGVGRRRRDKSSGDCIVLCQILNIDAKWKGWGN